MIAAPLALGALSTVLSPSATTGATTQAASVSSAGDSFSAMLSSFSNDTIDKLKGSEAMSIAGIQGSATTQSVVEAVMSAQEQLQTALAVRDKAVTAFQDISRMAI